MTFKPSTWYPIAALLGLANLAAVPFAVMPGEPVHATTHAVLAVAFGLWAQRLRQARRAGADASRAELESGAQARLDELDVAMNELRQELGEAQERLDFAERLLAQRPDRQPLP